MRFASTAAVLVATLVLTPRLQAQDVWEKIPPSPDVFGLLGLSHIAVDSQETLWAFTRSDMVFRSTDRGQTFTEYLDVQFRRSPGTVYASTIEEGSFVVGTQQDGVHMLENNGWEPYNNPSDGIRALAATNAGGLLAGAGGGIYALGPVVIGEGYTWTHLAEAGAVHDLLVLPDGIALAATEDGIYRSADDGLTWSLAYAHPNRPATYALGVTEDGTILASGIIVCPSFSGTGSYEGGVYRSTDSGESWSVASAGLSTPFGACIVPISDLQVTSDDEVLIAMEYQASFGLTPGVFISTDSGENWLLHNSGLEDGVLPQQFAISPSGHVYLYSHGAAEKDRNLYVRAGTATSSSDMDLPDEFELEQNYPNPFNPSTTISFSLGSPQHVHLAVYDALGRTVTLLANELRPAGRHEVQFQAGSLPSGAYLYRLETEGGTITRTLTLVR